MSEFSQHIAIIVCTYNRPVLLAAALRSILSMRFVDGVNIEIVVADNSDDNSARPIVRQLMFDDKIPIRYVEAHPPNISIARNAGIAATEAPVIAFLDDDQQLDAGWLRAVTDGLRQFPHEAFFGPITPRFEDEARASVQARRMFTRAHDVPAGTDLFAFGRRRLQNFPLSTANSIFRRDKTLVGPAPFAEQFGQGGEDAYLLFTLQRMGCRYGWLPDATASDFIPLHRCETSYLVRRHFTGGQIFAAALIRSSGSPRTECMIVWAKACLQLLALSFAALFQIRRRHSDLRMRMAAVIGKLFWPSIYPLYRAEERRLGSGVS